MSVGPDRRRWWLWCVALAAAAASFASCGGSSESEPRGDLTAALKLPYRGEVADGERFRVTRTGTCLTLRDLKSSGQTGVCTTDEFRVWAAALFTCRRPRDLVIVGWVPVEARALKLKAPAKSILMGAVPEVDRAAFVAVVGSTRPPRRIQILDAHDNAILDEPLPHIDDVSHGCGPGRFLNVR